MATPNPNAPDAPNNTPATPKVHPNLNGNSNGNPNVNPNGNVNPGGNGRHSTPLERLSQSERAQNAQDAQGAGARPAEQTSNDEALALYGAGLGAEGAGLDTDDTAMREFYGRLVTLLTQDAEGEAVKKKARGGIGTALRRRWLAALLVAGLAGYGLYGALKPRSVTYSASTTLLLPPRDASSKNDPFASPDDSYDTQAQLAIIGSEKIVASALGRVPLALRKKGWGNPPPPVVGVGVSALASDSLINISASSADPQASQRLVQEMVRAYDNYNKKRFSANKTENLGSTRARVQQTQRALDKARRDLRLYKERSGVFDAPAQQGSSAARISELESELGAARRQAATALADDAGLGPLRQSAGQAEIALRNLQRDFEADAPRVQVAQSELSRALELVRARESAVTAASAQRIRQLESSLAGARARAARLPAAEQDLGRLNSRLALAESAYTAAANRASQLGLSSAAVAPSAKPLSSVPGVGSDYEVKRARAMAVSLLGALLLGLACALALERLDGSVRAARDPQALFEAPILGALPAMRARGPLFIGGAGARSQTSGARARTAILEACTGAQSHILAAAAGLGARSLLITSSLPEEGKSQCAANLAAAMAYGGRQVLLIDADFWHPSQHEILEQELAPGYVQVLRDEIALSSAIRATEVPGLHLLTAGQKVQVATKRQPADPALSSAKLSELLRGENHVHVMEVLKRFFDVIVVDAPPVMSVSDAQLLSGLTDATILVAADHTNRAQVQRARAMLRLAGAVILGVVINSVRLGEVQRWNLDFSPEEPFSNYNTALSRR